MATKKPTLPIDITYNPTAKDIAGSTKSRKAALLIALAGGGRKGQKANYNHR